MTALTDLAALNQSLPALIQVGSRTFVPEDYGAVGDGIADDTAALQACHDAVAAAGGGTFLKTPGKVYGVTSAQDEHGRSQARWTNQYVTRWGLNLWGDNITLDGSGRIELLRKPNPSLPIPGHPSGVAAYNLVIGGHLIDHKTLNLSEMPVTRNLRILNGFFSTANSIPDADLESLNSSISGLVMVCNTRDFKISKITCTGGFGHIGVIGAHAGSEDGEVSDNFIQARKKIVNPTNGAWASLAGAGFCGDGLRNARILRNTIVDVLNGIGFNANADNQRAPGGLLVAENVIGPLKGIGLYITGGKDTQFSRNIVRSAVGFSGGIRLIAVERIEAGGAITRYPCFSVQATENLIEYTGPGTIKVGTGFDILSRSLVSMPANENGWHDFNRNALIRISKAFHLDHIFCHDVRGAGNYFNGAVNQFDDPALPSLNSIQAA